MTSGRGNHKPGISPRWRRWAPYICAYSCKSLLGHSSGLLFAFFLTETCDLPGVTMGAVIAVSLFANALADVAIGHVLSRPGRTGPDNGRLQAVGGGLAGLFFVSFCVTPFLPMVARWPYATAMLLGFRGGYALFDVSQNALVATMAPGAGNRGDLLAARNVCSGLPTLLIGALAAPMLLDGASDGALRHFAWAVTIALAAVSSAIGLARVDRPVSPPAPAAGPIGNDEDRSSSLLLILPVAALTVLASTLFRSLEPYAGAFAGMGSGLMVWIAIGAILCQPFWVHFDRQRHGGSAPAAAASFALVAAVIFGSPVRASPVGAALAGLSVGIGSGGVWLMVWRDALGAPGLADTTRRAAMLTAVTKCAQGVSVLALGQVLEGGGYRTTLRDAASLPSLAMAGALMLLAVAGIVLAIGRYRTGRAGTKLPGHTIGGFGSPPISSGLRG